MEIIHVIIFKIEFGVRQGSVLSPHLFAVLLDDMVAHLTFRNKLSIVLCADDILLLAPSVSELQRIVGFMSARTPMAGFVH